MVWNKEFATAALDSEDEILILHIASFGIFNAVYPLCKTMIIDITSTTIFPKYSNFADVFFLNLVAELSEYTEINIHAINLINSKEPLYGPIYSLRPVKLEIWKIYIEINFADDFLRSLKSLIDTLIIFV